MSGSRMTAAQTAALAALVGLAACGGGASPTTPSSPNPGGGTVGATITIGPNGAVGPAQVTIAVGQSVTFVNNDTRAHDMASDPHPSHTECPPLNAAGGLAPGQSKNTNAFPAVRTCGFHDHSNPGNAALMGRIVIQ